MAYPDNVYPLRAPEPFFAPYPDEDKPIPRKPLTPTQAHRLAGTPKPQEFIAGRLFPKGSLSMLFGPEGIGKSRLVMQLQVAAALGKDWLGLPTRKCKSFAVYGEDRDPQLQQLRDTVCEHYGCDPTELENMGWIDKSHPGGEDPEDPLKIIYKFKTAFSTEAKSTTLWKEFVAHAKEERVELLILDNVGLMFTGESNIQVTKFLLWLDDEAYRENISIAMLGHPAKARDAYWAGVAAWGRRPRLNLSLDRPPLPEKTPWSIWERTPLRRLKVEKGSYMAADDPMKLINLRMQQGGILKREEEMPLSADVRRDLDLKVRSAVKKLAKKMILVYREPTIGQCFSHIASNTDGWNGYPPRELDWSVDRNLNMGLLIAVDVDGNECLRGPEQEPLPGERAAAE